jgi:hypothetical protein
VVDECDRERVESMSWRLRRGPNGLRYAQARVPGGSGKNVYLHQFIIGVTVGMEVDHIDGDGLNNRRSNLRACTHVQNMRNMRHHKGTASRFKGVSWFSRDGCWLAYIVVGGRQVHLGYHSSEAVAALAYDVVANKWFGEFARLNVHEYPELADEYQLLLEELNRYEERRRILDSIRLTAGTDD